MCQWCAIYQCFFAKGFEPPTRDDIWTYRNVRISMLCFFPNALAHRSKSAVLWWSWTPRRSLFHRFPTSVFKQFGDIGHLAFEAGHQLLLCALDVWNVGPFETTIGTSCVVAQDWLGGEVEATFWLSRLAGAMDFVEEQVQSAVTKGHSFDEGASRREWLEKNAKKTWNEFIMK